MKKDLCLLLQGFLALFLASCSEADGVADGGSIEDQNAVSIEQLNEWYKFGTGLHESAYAKIDGGKFAVLEDGSGARAECMADSSTLAMTVQIYDLFSVSTLQAKSLGEACDSLFAAFEKECGELNDGQFFSISKGCAGGSFDATCRVYSVKSESENLLISAFGSVAADRCAEMAKNAQTSMGKFENASSSSKTQDGVSSSSVWNSDVCDSCEIVKPNDGAVTVDSSRTLENYVLQYTANAEKFSFENRVVAYNGTLSKNCGDYIFQTAGISLTDVFLNTPVILADDECISRCFPMTTKIMNESSENLKKKCSYFMALDNDDGQPMGHVLSSLSGDLLEFTSVAPGGMCVMSYNYFSVAFLIEDCNNEILPGELKSFHKSLKSEIWKCEEGSGSPTVNAKPYGEWFKSSLL